MSSFGVLPSETGPAPTLISPNTPRAIRAALIDAEREDFERRYAEEMAAAARTLDLSRVLKVLDVYRKIAEITQRQGVEAHRRMLDTAALLQRGEDVPTVPGHVHKTHAQNPRHPPPSTHYSTTPTTVKPPATVPPVPSHDRQRNDHLELTRADMVATTGQIS